MFLEDIFLQVPDTKRSLHFQDVFLCSFVLSSVYGKESEDKLPFLDVTVSEKDGVVS